MKEKKSDVAPKYSRTFLFPYPATKFKRDKERERKDMMKEISFGFQNLLSIVAIILALFLPLEKYTFLIST